MLNQNQSDWLLRLRRCSSIDTLEKVYENALPKLDGPEQFKLMTAADHRRAEITMGKLYDKVPAEVWKYVK